MAKAGFIGAGNMAEALIKAVLDKNIFKNNEIITSDKNNERLDHIKNSLKIGITNDNKFLVKNCSIIILSIKPQNMEEVLNVIKDEVTDKHLIVSIAAGIRVDYIENKLRNKRIIRVMPNAPCLVGEMAAGFSAGKYAKTEDIELVKKILNSAGKAFEVKEELIDAVTGLSGSGPAFLAYILEGLIEGGVEQGLSKNVAAELAMQTMKGTGKLLQKKKLTAKELIEIVSSPGGTTIAGREILENSDIKEILIKTVEAAAKRSRELGK